MIRLPSNAVKDVAIIRVPSALPPSIARPWEHVGPVLAQSVLEAGGDGGKLTEPPGIAYQVDRDLITARNLAMNIGMHGVQGNDNRVASRFCQC